MDADLCEWDYGGYEGVTTVEIHRTRPDWFLFDDGVAPGPPEHPGESPEQVGARAERMLAKVDAALAEAEGSVVLISHGHFLRVLTARRLGLRASDGALFQLATGTVSRLSTEHRRHVVAGWNVRPRRSLRVSSSVFEWVPVDRGRGRPRGVVLRLRAGGGRSRGSPRPDGALRPMQGKGAVMTRPPTVAQRRVIDAADPVTGRLKGRKRSSPRW